MKKILKLILVITVSTFIISSCDTNDSQLENIKENTTPIELSETEIALRKFEKSIIEAQTKIRDNTNLQKSIYAKTDNNNNNNNNNNNAEQLLDEISIASIAFLEDYGFTIDDYYDMFGTYNIVQIQKEIAGAGILLYALETNKILSPEIINLSSKNLASKGGDVRDCFLESTGIAAGIALVGALAGQAGGKAVRKAFIKVVKKLGGRLVGGIGLVLMAIDFTICMTTDTEAISATSNTCEDLLEAKSLYSGKTIYISKIDIDLVSSDNYAGNIKQTKLYQLYNVSYGYTPIAIQYVTEDTPCIVKKNIGRDAFILGKDIDLSSIKEYERLVFDDFFNAIPIKL